MKIVMEIKTGTQLATAVAIAQEIAEDFARTWDSVGEVTLVFDEPIKELKIN